MNMPEYMEGEIKVRAAQIEALESVSVPGAPGAVRLTFLDCPKQATVRGEWVAQNNPEVGGYFVLIDGSAAFMTAENFAKRFGQ